MQFIIPLLIVWSAMVDTSDNAVRTRTVPMPTEAEGEGDYVISVVQCEANGDFCGGTFSLTEGKATGNWDIVRDKTRDHRDFPLNFAGFRNIWSAFDALPDLAAAATSTSGLDPTKCYIINLTFEQKDQRASRKYMIRAATASPELKKWLGLIGWPGE